MSDEAAGVVGTGGAIGGSITTMSTPPVVPAKKRRSNGKSSSKSNGNGAATTADSNTRTIAITLPKTVLDWFEQAASQAPFEPSVQKYIAWELRQFAKNRQNAAKLAEEVEDDDTTLGVNDLH